jgi:hypothetical protein
MGESHWIGVCLHGEIAGKLFKRRGTARGCSGPLIRRSPPCGRLSRTASFSGARDANSLEPPILAILIVLKRWLVSWLYAPLHWPTAEGLRRGIGNSMIASCSSTSLRCFSDASVASRPGLGALRRNLAMSQYMTAGPD